MWEYKTIFLSPSGIFSFGKFDENELERALNKWGNQNWELVNVTTSSSMGDSNRLILFFKKAKQITIQI